MSKQVKTPRFYVDMPTFLHATGQLGWDDYKGGAELLYMNCANPVMREDDSNTMFVIGNQNQNTPKTSFPINFCALLNHNFGTETLNITSWSGLGNTMDGQSLTDTNIYNKNVLNANINNALNNTISPEYNGTSIWTFTETNDYFKEFQALFPTGYDTSTNHQLGSFVVGKYWDAPYSPDLNLTMSRSFAGIKKQKTIGGKTLANIYYDGPTEWTMNDPDGTYKYPPFELDTTGTDFNQRVKSGLGRKGLRSWKLTFSYIPDGDMWMENEVSNTLTSDDVTPNNDIPNPMLSDESFNFVWNCTLGGTLPFIFQPDKTNNNPDQFSICTFRENTLNVQQNGPNVYQLSVTIDEVA